MWRHECISIQSKWLRRIRPAVFNQLKLPIQSLSSSATQVQRTMVRTDVLLSMNEAFEGVQIWHSSSVNNRKSYLVRRDSSETLYEVLDIIRTHIWKEVTRIWDWLVRSEWDTYMYVQNFTSSRLDSHFIKLKYNIYLSTAVVKRSFGKNMNPDNTARRRCKLVVQEKCIGLTTADQSFKKS